MDEKQPSLGGSVSPAMGAWVAREGKRPQMFSSPDKIQQMKFHADEITFRGNTWRHLDGNPNAKLCVPKILVQGDSKEVCDLRDLTASHSLIGFLKFMAPFLFTEFIWVKNVIVVSNKKTKWIYFLV